MLDIQKTDTAWHTTSHNTVPPELLHSLRHHSLFQRANNESFLEKIACRMHLRTYGPRDVIVVEGEPAKAMFFLLRGSVDVCSADFERIYANLSQGSCFGEIGILYSMPRTATVIARTKCIVASLTAEEVNNLLPQYPEVEKMLRFEAEERLAVLNKSKNLGVKEKVSLKPMTERNIEDFTGIRQLLQKIPFFQGCPEEFLHLISLKVEPRHYAPNAIIISKGEYGSELIFIISGTVELTNTDDSGILVPITRLSPGDYFGAISVLLNTPRATNARAVTALELYILKKSDFMDVVHHFPDLLGRFKAMAEISLSHLQSMTGVYQMRAVEEAIDTPISPRANHEQLSPEGLSSLTIPTNSVCSTTADQDPTLLPPTPTSNLKKSETRRRRASVAVWSDPNLVALANRHIKPDKHETQQTKMMTESTQPQPKISQPVIKGQLSLFTEDILSRIVNCLDFTSILQLSMVSKQCREFIQQNNNVLKSLDWSSMHKKITDSNVNHLVQFTGSRVRSLNLSQCFYLTDDGFKALVENLPSVEAMDLSSCWLLTDKSLALLGTACPQLTRLNLSNCRKISDTGIFRLLDAKASNAYPMLEELSVSYCKKLSDTTMRHLASYCSNTLQLLNLQRCTRITDIGFLAWTSTHFPQLQELNLNDCSFLTDQAIGYLISATPNLKRLSLSFCCALSDSAIERLATLKQLEYLDVSFCGAAVSDVSVRTLLASQSMGSLNIRGCVRVTDTTIYSILELGQLRMLNISQCPGISPNAKEAIKAPAKLQELIV
ncbi:hypothetical protein RMCBS344292_00077 [Rhizopus microsporus]|nr:hypothetical protein RMCBS344292_00077 [Rhizopus microsporus]